MEPEYFNVVTNPIDLLKIQHKLKSDDYSSVDLLTADVELMVNNAKAYYKVRVYCLEGILCFRLLEALLVAFCTRVENKPCLVVVSRIHLDYGIVLITHAL